MSTRAMPMLLLAASLGLALSGPASAQQASDTVAPEAATSPAPSLAAVAKRQMVVAANPLAAQVGRDILRAGGTAADAIVAIQAVLGLVEPQSSGLGGGAFLVWYDAASGKVTTFDGRETTPKRATQDLFLGPDGKPMKFFDAVVGGRSVGTPGVVRLLAAAHDRFGKLDWAGLFDPAIDLARQGFDVSPRLAALVADDAGRLGGEPTTRDYFLPGGKPLQAGQRLRNEAYAQTLAALASGGPQAFYTGPIAEAIVAAVHGHARNPGLLAADDLASYAAVERPAVCAPYRGLDVCGMGPPSSGGLAIGQILGMVEPFDLATLGPDDPQSWRIIGDATRLAFADRERYVADADFVSVPDGLLDADYLKARSQLLRRPTALPADAVAAGEPRWDKAELRRDGISAELPSTTHFVVVDADGNVAAMTSSIENGFGARLMSGGFLLNNQLTDFSFEPQEDGHVVANRVEPGKRPRSSMSPTIILRDGRPAFALGSPGGSNIIPYVAKTIVALVDWRMDIARAVALPHLANRFGTYDLEAGTSAEALAKDLEALGYSTAAKEQNSGLHGVAFTPEGIVGGADPRREGVALGD
jgi:gamma-glutamyltranspeptidase/glutathione hydrolase